MHSTWYEEEKLKYTGCGSYHMILYSTIKCILSFDSSVSYSTVPCFRVDGESRASAGVAVRVRTLRQGPAVAADACLAGRKPRQQFLLPLIDFHGNMLSNRVFRGFLTNKVFEDRVNICGNSSGLNTVHKHMFTNRSRQRPVRVSVYGTGPRVYMTCHC